MNDIFIKLDNLLKEDTNNDNFKIWFGSSKVLDESGNPMVMYHGSCHNFDTFDRKTIKYVGCNGDGFYFTPDKNYAKTYGANVNAYYLRIEHPLTPNTKSLTYSDYQKILNYINKDEDYKDNLKNYGYFEDRDYRAFRDKLAREFSQKTDYISLFDLTNTTTGSIKYLFDIISKVTDKKFDGVISEVFGEWVVFDSNQIKSATNNNGNYSLTSNNINEGINQSIFKNSKVVDKNGKLLKVYHGTRYKFDKFELVGQTDDGYYGLGFYFTDDYEYASEYGRIVMECYLNIENPFILLKDGSSDSESLFELRDALSKLKGMPKDLKTNRVLPKGYHIEKVHKNVYGQDYELYEVYPDEEYYGTDKEIYSYTSHLSPLSATVYFNDLLNDVDYNCGWATSLLKKLDRNNFHNVLIDNGYDGIFVKDYKSGNIDEYVVFDNQRIKILNHNINENVEMKNVLLNSNGKPLMVYHGTDKVFSKFNISKYSNKYSNNAMGIFFTSNPKMASLYSGQKKNSSIIPCYLIMKNPYYMPHYEYQLYQNYKSISETKQLIVNLSNKGFDGIISDDNYIVFNEEQIINAYLK